MIKLSKLNGAMFVLNCDLIETIEHTPNTLITLNNGKKLIVSDSIDEIIEKVVYYKRHLNKPKIREV